VTGEDFKQNPIVVNQTIGTKKQRGAISTDVITTCAPISDVNLELKSGVNSYAVPNHHANNRDRNDLYALDAAERRSYLRLQGRANGQ
jgi:hypothetical protein